MRLTGMAAILAAERVRLPVSVGRRHSVPTRAARRLADTSNVWIGIEATGLGGDLEPGQCKLDLALELGDVNVRAVRKTLGPATSARFVRAFAAQGLSKRAELLTAAQRIGLRTVVETEIDQEPT